MNSPQRRGGHGGHVRTETLAKVLAKGWTIESRVVGRRGIVCGVTVETGSVFIRGVAGYDLHLATTAYCGDARPEATTFESGDRVRMIPVGAKRMAIVEARR